MCLVEVSGSYIALKRPEVKTSGTELFRLAEERSARSLTDVRGIDVELIEPAVMDAHHRDNSELVFDHPRPAVR